MRKQSPPDDSTLSDECEVPDDRPIYAEVIAIGDELTSGQRLDTNSQWLSQQLGELGIRTLFHTTVADDLASNLAAFQAAAGRVDLVLVTGGLGPTADDLTRESMAQAFALPLQLDASALARIEWLFSSRGREMPDRNRVQAMFPEGACPIDNPHGTAPGIDLTAPGGCRFFALPGVPAEMKEMFAETVRERLLRAFGDRLRPIRHFRLKCFGAGESSLEAMLPDLIRRGREPSVGITVSRATITLRVSGQAPSSTAFEQLIAPTVATIHQSLGELVFGEEDDELEHAVSRLLQVDGRTLAVAEWGTSGLLTKWLHEVEQQQADPRPLFAGGIVVSGPTAARRSLGVTVDELDPPSLARELARQARAKFDADFAISVGPLPEREAQPDAAKVYLGLATATEEVVVGRRLVGHPDILVPLTAKQALNELRLYLLRQHAKPDAGERQLGANPAK